MTKKKLREKHDHLLRELVETIFQRVWLKLLKNLLIKSLKFHLEKTTMFSILLWSAQDLKFLTITKIISRTEYQKTKLKNMRRILNSNFLKMETILKMFLSVLKNSKTRKIFRVRYNMVQKSKALIRYKSDKTNFHQVSNNLKKLQEILVFYRNLAIH